MIKYEHIGWCREGTSDKVWGVICLTERIDTTFDPRYGYQDGTPGKYVIFWGRRGKKLQTKIFEDTNWEIYKMFRKKLNKGYQEVDKQKLDEVYPEFETDLEKTATWAILLA